MEKICRRCGVLKSVKKFKTDKRQVDGRTVTCRDCYTYNKLDKFVRTKEQIESQREKILGRKYSESHKLAISEGLQKAAKEGRHLWVKNNVRHKEQERCYTKYKLWKAQVFKKYNNKCNRCEKNQRLHCHHIMDFHQHPELRYDVNNGELLCISCHMRHHKIIKL